MTDPLNKGKKYLELSYRYLTIRSRSEKEIHDYLRKKKAPDEVIEQIIKTLKEQKFLNDVEFAKSWVEQRITYRPKSMYVIKMELRQKGITDEIIEEVTAMQNFHGSEKESQHQIDMQSATRLVKERIGKYKGMDKFALYQKLGGFLGRRGFDWDTIKHSIDDVLENGV